MTLMDFESGTCGRIMLEQKLFGKEKSTHKFVRQGQKTATEVRSSELMKQMNKNVGYTCSNVISYNLVVFI